MDRLLSRDGFVAVVARGLGLAPETFDGEAVRAWDPVALLRLDELVSTELGVELPESVLMPSTDIDAIYRAYVLECVTSDLGATGGGPR
jgi:hypothetical protein